MTDTDIRPWSTETHQGTPKHPPVTNQPDDEGADRD